MGDPWKLTDHDPAVPGEEVGGMWTVRDRKTGEVLGRITRYRMDHASGTVWLWGVQPAPDFSIEDYVPTRYEAAWKVHAARNPSQRG